MTFSFVLVCDFSPLEMPDVPTVTLNLSANKSFQVVNPTIVRKDGEVCLSCLRRKIVSYVVCIAEHCL